MLRSVVTLDGYGLAALLYEAMLAIVAAITDVEKQGLYEEEATNRSVCIVMDGFSYDAAHEEPLTETSSTERWWVLSWINYFDEVVMPYVSEKLNNLSYLHIVTFLALVATPWIKPVKTLKEKDLITTY